jgi:2'-5' RNA ligase
MEGCNGGGEAVNSYALVSYLPDPLAAFLNRLRNDLVDQCHSKAHVTVLPPRPLPVPSLEAWLQLQEHLQDVEPFRVELDGIEVFPVTDVIYVSVGAGFAELEKLHVDLNRGALAFQEPFIYHPHITLAQHVAPDQLASRVALAQERWREFTGPRGFLIDRLTFVQNTLDDRWLDLNAFQLAGPVEAGRR